MTDSLSLSYSVTMDDVIAWNQYHLSHSAVYKRIYWIQITLLCAIIFAAVLASSGSDATGMHIAVLVTGVVFCVMLSQRKRGVARYVRKAYAEGKNRGTLGPHRLIITDGGFSSSTEIGDGNINWRGIERIVQISGYSFVCVGALAAYVIPEHRITEGDYSAFMAELKRRWEATNAGQTDPAG